MTTLRAIPIIVAATTVGYLIAVCVTGLATPRSVGVAIAVIASAVIGYYLIKAIETDQEKQ